MNIPSECSWIGFDGDVRTVSLQVSEAGYVTPLTRQTMQVLPLAQLRLERDRIREFASLSTADWVTVQLLTHRIAQLETPLAEREAELGKALALRDCLLSQLQPFTVSIEGDGVFAQSARVRHDQLLRALEDAESRVLAAQDALATVAAVA